MSNYFKGYRALYSLIQKRKIGEEPGYSHGKVLKYLVFAVIPTVKFPDGTILSIVQPVKMPFYDQ